MAKDSKAKTDELAEAKLIAARMLATPPNPRPSKGGAEPKKAKLQAKRAPKGERKGA
jgi:hypothetical protein